MIKNKCSIFVLVGVNNLIYPLGVRTMNRPHYLGFDRNRVFRAKSWAWEYLKRFLAKERGKPHHKPFGFMGGQPC